MDKGMIRRFFIGFGVSAVTLGGLMGWVALGVIVGNLGDFPLAGFILLSLCTFFGAMYAYSKP